MTLSKTLLASLVLLAATPALFAQSAMREAGEGTHASPRAGRYPPSGRRKTGSAWTPFTHCALPDEVFERMRGVSYPDEPAHASGGTPIPRDQLRYVMVLHHTADGEVRKGELVVCQDIADDIVDIFRQLYDAHYPIERMELVDNYGGDDERSMSHNNSSAFNHRTVAGTTTLSAHARGMAVDINPLYNPAVRRNEAGTIVQPATAVAYADRSTHTPYTITANDLCVKLFKQHGFRWGGDWTSLKDWQHFEK